MDYQNTRIREIRIFNLPLLFSVLVKGGMPSFSIFSSNSYREKCKYYNKENIFNIHGFYKSS